MNILLLCWSFLCFGGANAFTATRPVLLSQPLARANLDLSKNNPIQHDHPTIIQNRYNSIFHQSNNDNNEDNENSNELLNRFLSPKIDDAGLPLTDALFAQIIAPTLQLFWLSLNHAPLPTWLYSIKSADLLFETSTRQGSLIAPTLIHGAGLAVCWALGALSAKSYESDAFNISGGRGYGEVLKRIVQAGSFATGVLIFSTQLDLFIEYGGRYVQPGESEEIDVRLLSAIVELINDVVFEAGVLGLWRLYRASLTGDESGRPPNYDPYA